MNSFFYVSSLIGMVLVFISTSRYGVGTTPDSIVYICIATIKDSLSSNVSPFFTPLFPVLLSLLGLLGINPLCAARLINALTFGLIIFTFGQLLRASIHSKKLIISGVLLILFSIPLLKVSVMAWTEPLFILLAILFIIYLFKFLNQKQSFVLVTLSVITAFSCLQRYIGITLVLTGLLSFIFLLPRESFIQKLKYITIFCVISITPYFIWLTHNYVFTNRIFGARFPSDINLWRNIYFSLDVITTWFVPGEVPFLIRALSFIIGVSTIAGSVLLVHLKYKQQAHNVLIKILPACFFVLAYSTCLIILATITDMDQINDRLLSPVYVFIVLLALVGIEYSLNLFSQALKNRRAVKLIIMALFILWLAYPLTRIIRYTAKWISTGAGGYNTARWRGSSLIRWLLAHPLDGLIYSNDPHAIYIFLGKIPRVPLKSQYSNIYKTADDLQRIKELLKVDKRAYLVWFYKPERKYLYSRRDFYPELVLEKIASFPEGVVYLLRQKELAAP